METNKKTTVIDGLIILTFCLIALTPFIYKKIKLKKQPDFQKKIIIATINFEGVWKDFLKNIEVGDIANLSKDKNIGEIVSIETKPTQKMVLPYDAAEDKVEKSETIDILLRVKLETDLINSRIRFNNQDIKVGQPFILKSPKIDLSGIINNIEVIE